MAKAPSKRKRPSRDKFMLKEVRKIESEVFDRATLLVLAKFLKKGLIQTVDYPISTGKEANVFRATVSEGHYAVVKIYKIETAPFFRRSEYLEGDPRFSRIKHSEAGIVEAFCRKEFKNLQIAERAGVHAPRSMYVEKNALLMSFLGEKGVPYPAMDAVPPHDEADLDSVLEDIRKLYHAGLVHADISEYNLLRGDVPYLIDFGQGVILRHPHAEQYLERDVQNVLRYFGKFGYRRDGAEVLKGIRKPHAP